MLWNVEGLPVSVEIGPAVLADLQRILSESATEFGGVLLGRVESGNGRFHTVVDAFKPFPIEHRYGTTYSLSEQDRRQLQRRLRRVAAGQLTAVGLCRSHERRGMYLDQRDFDLFQQVFQQPASIFLLVRRDNGAQATGGIFLWEENDMRRHAPHREFSLSAPQEPPRVERPVEDKPAKSRPQPGLAAPLRPWLVPAALALATGALPVIAYFTARTVAIHRAAPPTVARAERSPLPRPAQSDAAPPVRPAEPAALDAPAAVPRSTAESRDRAAFVPPAAPPSPSEPAREASLPEPPAMETRSHPPAPALLNTRAAMPVRPPDPVIAYIKPEPPSFVRRALQRFSGHGEGFVDARPLDHPLPEVPRRESLAGGESAVELRARIGRRGTVVGLKPVSGDPLLARASQTALAHWTFEPARVNGEPVESEMIVRFVFHHSPR